MFLILILRCDDEKKFEKRKRRIVNDVKYARAELVERGMYDSALTHVMSENSHATEEG
jgi:hypothetical protein